MRPRAPRWAKLLPPLAPALALATSCTPNAPVAGGAKLAARTPPPVTDGRALLRRLDLDVPVGVPTETRPETVLPSISAAPPPFLAAGRSAEDGTRAADCLTAAVYYEARSEPVDGQRAVAQVVLNRVRDRAFPASVCGVVYQGVGRGRGCQFSFACDGSTDRPREPSAWDRARAIAEAALGGYVYAPVGSATHYHADYVLPWWASSLARVGVIGRHIFYRWAGGLERALAFRQSYAGVEPMAAAIPAVAMAGQAGVTVHRGGEPDAAGVFVHRGATAPAPADDEDEGTMLDAPAAVAVAGVRVHYGPEGGPS